ncbi:hypothetical protein DFH08DRAFT_620091, partial [Mycena albidolilacea]
FLVYQISDTQHIIMDNMIDKDVLIPSEFIRDTDFDIIGWYAVHRGHVLSIPED